MTFDIIAMILLGGFLGYLFSDRTKLGAILIGILDVVRFAGLWYFLYVVSDAAWKVHTGQVVFR